jgi:hypothetical protein
MAKKPSEEELPNEQHIDIDESVKKKVEELMGPPPMESKVSLGKEFEDQAPTKKPDAPRPGQVIEQEAVSEDQPGEKILVLDGNSSKSPEEVLAEVPETEPEVPAPVEDAKPSEKEIEPSDDPETDKVVDEIVAKEGDDILEAEDEKVAAAFSKEKPNFKDKIKNALSVWWNTPKYRWPTLAGLGLLLVILGIVPVTRYFMLNTVGVRASASVKVVDSETNQPLKNVQVKIAGKIGTTDKEGNVRLTGLKLGRTALSVERRAFAPTSRPVTIGWGSNPLGDLSLKPTGSQYSFAVTDFLANSPLEKVEAVSGEFSALSDKDGKIVLTVDKKDIDELKVSIILEDYRTEEVTITAATQGEQAVKLVPSRKHAFISKRSGKFDLYKIDVDGKNEEKVLAGTGNETQERMTLSQHPSQDVAAFVSTRDNKRNKDGYLLSSLIVIDLKTNTQVNIDTSERIELVDWASDRLVFVKITEGASAGNPKRYRLLSVNQSGGDLKELATANYFNDVLAARGSIYYAPSKTQGASVGLYKISADGSSKQTVHNEEVWNIFRTDYDKLMFFSASQAWYDLKINETKAVKAAGPPAVQRTRQYIDSKDGQSSLWTEERDGKGVLIKYDQAAKTEAVLQSIKGLKYPIRWMTNDHVVFRVNDSKETADYIVNVKGKEPKKIQDVTDISGVDSWYYY